MKKNVVKRSAVRKTSSSKKEALERDFSNYLAVIKFVQGPVSKGRKVKLQLPVATVDQVKAVAAQLGFSFQTLMCLFIAEGLVRDQAGLRAKTPISRSSRTKSRAR